MKKTDSIEEYRAYQREQYAKHKEKRRAARRARYWANPEKARADALAYQHRKRGAPKIRATTSPKVPREGNKRKGIAGESPLTLRGEIRNGTPREAVLKLKPGEGHPDNQDFVRRWKEERGLVN